MQLWLNPLLQMRYRVSVNEVLHDEETHSGAFQRTSQSPNVPVGPQAMLDIILHRESWHKRGGGWIGQAIYGANDGLGSVFGIVTGVAGATAGGPAVLIAGLRRDAGIRVIHGLRRISCDQD